MITHKAVCQFNEIFRPVNECRKRYRILKGSAGSGKSTNLAMDYVKKLSDMRYKGANLLVVRKVDETNRDSTFAELQAAVYRLFGEYTEYFWQINLSPLSMMCKTTGNRIIFRGMKDDKQREKVKSITFKTGKLTWIWIEEATELTQKDVDILDDRLRGILPNSNLFYQITMSFNPVSISHWIKPRYFDTPSEDTFTHHSTYLSNRFMDKGYYKRMERRKLEDPEGYQVYGLGEWGETGGLVLTNWESKEFEHEPAMYDCMTYGQDFGFNHANCLLDIGFRDGNIYIGNEIYVFEHDTQEIIDLAAKAKVDKKRIMYCDSAEPDRIKMWCKAGYWAQGVHKDTNSVSAQIDYLKQHKIFIHPRCVNTIQEIRQWKWKLDKTTGEYTDEPVSFMDDAMAALRYSIEEIRRGRAAPKPMRVNY